MTFAQNSLVQISREIEVTPGVVVGGDRKRVYGTAPTWDPVGSTKKSGLITGEAAIHSVRAGQRGATVSIPSELVFLLNILEWEDFFRDSLPASEVTLTDVSVTFDPAGAQIPVVDGGLGGTGPIITAAAGVFDDIVSADHQGCILEVSGGGVNADNKWPRGIYIAKADGTQIDLMPEYAAGSPGAFGSPLISEGPVTATLKLGKMMKNKPIENARHVNFEFNNTDISAGAFNMVRGARAGTFKLAGDGDGIITTQVDYEAMDYDDETAATQGSGTVDPNTAIDNDSMVFSEDLGYFVVNGVTVLSGDNLGSWSLDGTGTPAAVPPTGGRRDRAGVTVGDVDMSGSIKLYQEAVKLRAVAALARAGTRVPLAAKIQDPAGNFYWIHLPRTLFEPAAAKPGQKTALTDGSFNYMTQMGPGSMRTIVVQAFAA